MTGSALTKVHVSGSSHGGAFSKNQPRVIVIHSVQCPIASSQAGFRMGLLSQRPDASAHYLVDPTTIASGVDENTIAWGAGTVNSAAIHVEFCGYAEYTRAQWTTALGKLEIELGGKLIADVAKRHGIPLRWLTDAQLLAAWKGLGLGGLTTHDQCRRVIGGTTHTDPGAGFPEDLLLSAAQGKTKEEDDMADALAKKLKLTDYRGRFTKGTSPEVTNTIEGFIGNTWEFTKYAAGRLDQQADEIAALKATLNKIAKKVGA